jgi:hypothetical protein
MQSKQSNGLCDSLLPCWYIETVELRHWHGICNFMLANKAEAAKCEAQEPPKATAISLCLSYKAPRLCTFNVPEAAYTGGKLPRRWLESHQQYGLGSVVPRGSFPDCRRCSRRSVSASYAYVCRELDQCSIRLKISRRCLSLWWCYLVLSKVCSQIDVTS